MGSCLAIEFYRVFNIEAKLFIILQGRREVMGGAYVNTEKRRQDKKQINVEYKERQTVLTLFLKDRRTERRIVGYCTHLQNERTINLQHYEQRVTLCDISKGLVLMTFTLRQ